jgi:WD40 repeat protein
LDNTIKLWNLNSGEELRSFPRQPSIVESISLSPDGQTLASGGWGNIIKLWNLSTGEEIRTLSNPEELGVGSSEKG